MDKLAREFVVSEVIEMLNKENQKLIERVKHLEAENTRLKLISSRTANKNTYYRDTSNVNPHDNSSSSWFSGI